MFLHCELAEKKNDTLLPIIFPVFFWFDLPSFVKMLQVRRSVTKVNVLNLWNIFYYTPNNFPVIKWKC